MKTTFWISYPTEYKNQLKPLLHQQMWLFGRDILCPEGNLLYQYRFTHERSEKRGGSMYTRLDDDRQIVLWGWGIWFGQAEKGAIFVNRFKAQPRYTHVATLSQTIYREESLPHLTHRVDSQTQVEAMSQLWAELLQWLAAYEAWVIDKVGPSWRQAALKPFNHAVTPLVAVDQLAMQWQTLSEQSQTLPIKSNTP
ncbi:MAG: hypothetical protein AAF633_28910 [Chloroflexota bacterium]